MTQPFSITAQAHACYARHAALLLLLTAAVLVALLAYALAQGHALHDTNGLVKQAESAARVDTFVRSLGNGDVTVAFVPDTGRARIDTGRRPRPRAATSCMSSAPTRRGPLVGPR